MAKLAEDFQENQSLLWLRDWIQNHTGIVFPDQKIPILQQRLHMLLLSSHYKNIHELIEAVKNQPSPDLVNSIVELATTNHTHFYREHESIDYMIHHIVPSFSNQEIRLWSAAASSGEELYTICMSLIEHYGLDTISRRFSFLGTDVNSKVVEHAEKGIYNSARLEHIPLNCKDKWFSPAGLDSWSLNNQIRSLCLFRRLNLLSHPWPFMKKFHITFLRNILYYFDTETQRSLLLKLYQASEPGGWLITSVTENISSLDLPWHRVQSNIFRKVEGS